MLLTILQGTGQSHTHNDMAPNISTAEAGAPRGALSLEEMFPLSMAIACTDRERSGGFSVKEGSPHCHK